MCLKDKFQLKTFKKNFQLSTSPFITLVLSTLNRLFAPPYTQNKPKEKSK